MSISEDFPTHLWSFDATPGPLANELTEPVVRTNFPFMQPGPPFLRKKGGNTNSPFFS